MPEPEGLQTTVHRLRKAPVNLVEAERRSLGRTGRRPADLARRRPAQEGRDVPRLEGVPGRIQSVLERKGQVILYGPPGTGKTYWAERTALDLASYSLARQAVRASCRTARGPTSAGGPEPSGSSACAASTRPTATRTSSRATAPNCTTGGWRFALRDGIFKQLCRDAEAQPDRQLLLIIDEINRGDIPRIFGELLTVIEKDKRGKSVLLPLSRSAFRVPPNVLLIGTMNTADRSIALLDTALRRRFGFVELMPDASLLERGRGRRHPPGSLAGGAEPPDLRARRAGRPQPPGRALVPDGGGRPVRDAARFFRVVRDEIIPLLEEYCYEDFDALHAILGGGLVDLPNRAIRHDLFEEPTGPELVQALLAARARTS